MKLSHLIGQALARERTRAGRSQQAVSDLSYLVGLDWDRSVISRVESGQRGISAEELAVLPALFRLVTGEWLDWSAIIEADQITLNDLVEVTPTVWMDIMAGRDFPALGLSSTESQDVWTERTMAEALGVDRGRLLEAAALVLDEPPGAYLRAYKEHASSRTAYTAEERRVLDQVRGVLAAWQAAESKTAPTKGARAQRGDL